MAVRTLSEWRRSLGNPVDVMEVDDGFPAVLRRLEPLTGGIRPRELLVETSGEWTAYFDCSIQGTDAVSTIGHLSRWLGYDGVAVTAIPHTHGLAGVKDGRFGSLQFEMFGPNNDGHFLNYVRTIALAHTGKAWVFTANGIRQPFEHTDAYSAHLIRDRFSSTMLESYCHALGIDVFEEAFYGPRAALIRTDVPIPANGLVMTLEEAQAWQEIRPGVADGVAG